MPSVLGQGPQSLTVKPILKRTRHGQPGSLTPGNGEAQREMGTPVADLGFHSVTSPCSESDSSDTPPNFDVLTAHLNQGGHRDSKRCEPASLCGEEFASSGYGKR